MPGVGGELGRVCFVGVRHGRKVLPSTMVDDDSVAALSLRAEQGDVGGPAQVFQRIPVAAVCHPEARGERRHAARGQRENQLFLYAAQRAGGRIDRKVGEGDDELFAAVAAHQVIGADRGPQGAGEQPQGPVAGVVSMGVVEHLEMVEVAHRE